MKHLHLKCIMKSLTPVSHCKLCCFVGMYPKGFNPGRGQNREALTLFWGLQDWWATISLQRSSPVSVCQGTLVWSYVPLIHPVILLSPFASAEQEDSFLLGCNYGDILLTSTDGETDPRTGLRTRLDLPFLLCLWVLREQEGPGFIWDC